MTWFHSLPILAINCNNKFQKHTNLICFDLFSIQIHIQKQDMCQDIYTEQDTTEISTDVLLGVDDVS